MIPEYIIPPKCDDLINRVYDRIENDILIGTDFQLIKYPYIVNIHKIIPCEVLELNLHGNVIDGYVIWPVTPLTYNTRPFVEVLLEEFNLGNYIEGYDNIFNDDYWNINENI